MDILQISGSRMKITLTREDLDRFSVCGVRPDADAPENKRALDAVLAAAGRITGADLTSGKIYVQLYPSKDGGCEIFVWQSRRAPGGCALVPAKDMRACYLLAPEKGSEQAWIALFRRAGVCGAVYLDEQSGRTFLLCLAAERDLLMLEEYGRRVKPGVQIYMNEHFRQVARL